MPVWTFVRHGESVANAEGWLAGHVDAPLTERGMAQAEAIRTELGTAAIARAFASDLSRARSTARIILRGRDDVSLVLSPALRERSCGAWARRRIADLDAAGLGDACLRGWSTHPPGGETLRQVALRACAWLASIDDGPDALVVTHGALLRALIGALDEVPTDAIGRHGPRNCEVIRRELELGTWARLLDRLRADARGSSPRS